eukprot:157482_1
MLNIDDQKHCNNSQKEEEQKYEAENFIVDFFGQQYDASSIKIIEEKGDILNIDEWKCGMSDSNYFGKNQAYQELPVIDFKYIYPLLKIDDSDDIRKYLLCNKIYSDFNVKPMNATNTVEVTVSEYITGDDALCLIFGSKMTQNNVTKLKVLDCSKQYAENIHHVKNIMLSPYCSLQYIELRKIDSSFLCILTEILNNCTLSLLETFSIEIMQDVTTQSVNLFCTVLSEQISNLSELMITSSFKNTSSWFKSLKLNKLPYRTHLNSIRLNHKKDSDIHEIIEFLQHEHPSVTCLEISAERHVLCKMLLDLLDAIPTNFINLQKLRIYAEEDIHTVCAELLPNHFKSYPNSPLRLIFVEFFAPDIPFLLHFGQNGKCFSDEDYQWSNEKCHLVIENRHCIGEEENCFKCYRYAKIARIGDYIPKGTYYSGKNKQGDIMMRFKPIANCCPRFGV